MDLSLALQLRALDHLAADVVAARRAPAAGVDRRRGGGVAARRRGDPHRRADDGATARRDDVVSAVTIHAAAAVVPVAAPPIADGAVAVAGGRIVAVGERDATSSPPIRRRRRRLGRRARAGARQRPHPPAVHVVHGRRRGAVPELRALGRPLPRGVHGPARTTTGGRPRSTGIAAGLRSGTTCFGDVVTDEPALDVLVAAGVAGVAYFEIIGVDAERWDGGVEARVTEVLTERAAHGALPRRAVAARALQRRRAGAAGVDRAGPAARRCASTPTSPRSTPRTSSTGRAPASWADRIRPRHDRGWPQFDAGGVGPRRRRVRRARAGCSGPTATSPTASTSAPTGAGCSPMPGTSVALCPRSNLTVGIDPPPVADFLREGVPFCVGTDSLGSNASLDLLADVALLRRLAVDGGYDRCRPRPPAARGGDHRRGRRAGARPASSAPSHRVVGPTSPCGTSIRQRPSGRSSPSGAGTLRGHRRRRGTSARGLTLRHFPS